MFLLAFHFSIFTKKETLNYVYREKLIAVYKSYVQYTVQLVCIKLSRIQIYSSISLTLTALVTKKKLPVSVLTRLLEPSSVE